MQDLVLIAYHGALHFQEDTTSGNCPIHQVINVMRGLMATRGKTQLGIDGWKEYHLTLSKDKMAPLDPTPDKSFHREFRTQLKAMNVLMQQHLSTRLNPTKL